MGSDVTQRAVDKVKGLLACDFVVQFVTVELSQCY